VSQRGGGAILTHRGRPGSRVGMVVLGYKKGQFLEPSSNKPTLLLSTITTPMAHLLDRQNSRRYVTPMGDEVTRPRGPTRQVDNFGDPYLTAAEVRFDLDPELS
jgi:hypothetical protein